MGVLCACHTPGTVHTAPLVPRRPAGKVLEPALQGEGSRGQAAQGLAWARGHVSWQSGIQLSSPALCTPCPPRDPRHWGRGLPDSQESGRLPRHRGPLAWLGEAWHQLSREPGCDRRSGGPLVVGARGGGSSRESFARLPLWRAWQTELLPRQWPGDRAGPTRGANPALLAGHAVEGGPRLLPEASEGWKAWEAPQTGYPGVGESRRRVTVAP